MSKQVDGCVEIGMEGSERYSLLVMRLLLDLKIPISGTICHLSDTLIPNKIYPEESFRISHDYANTRDYARFDFQFSTHEIT